MNNYYVYLYKDPISYESFYVGMGKGIRMFHHLKEATSFAHTDPNKRKIRKIQKIIAKGWVGFPGVKDLSSSRTINECCA
jgi:hypothetical protein